MYDHNFTQINELTNYLINQGHKVLFVENTGTRSISFYDYRRIFHRLKKYFSTTLGFEEKKNLLTVFSPIFFPFQFLKLFVKINSFIIHKSVSKWIFENNSPTIIISFLPNPISNEIVKKINNKVLIYYCADDMIANSNNKKILKRTEERIVNQSDLIFYTSKKLGSKFKNYNNSSLIRNGVDFKKFNQIDISKINKKKFNNSKKIIGYVGAIRLIIDFELLYKIAEIYSDYALVFIGPVYPQVLQNEYYQKIRNKENVFFLGSIDHKDIPFMTSNFDISIIPYIKNTITDSIYPVKLNEYLAQGLAVLSVNIDEIIDIDKENDEILHVYKNHEECINLIDQAINSNSDTIKKARIDYAKNNDWSNKFNQIYEKIIIKIEENSKKSNFENKILLNFKHRFKKNFLSIVSFLLLYFAIMHSPLFPLLSKNLIYQEDLFTNENLIAFMGSGEANYNNFSYRKRALEILEYYDSKNTNNIIIISGRFKEIADVEIVKAFLTSRGIEKNKIKIPQKLPTSTYEGVLLAYKEIEDIKNESFLILTSPFHSYRLKKTWEKNYDNIKVIFPTYINNDDVIYFYGMPFNKIKIVIYEFLAIIHNKMNSRI